LARGGVRGVVPAALVLAGERDELLRWWKPDLTLPQSNALREAIFVRFGGEVPPVVVRDDMPEEAEDIQQRTHDDHPLRERFAGAPATPGRWGNELTEMGPRHRRWLLTTRALLQQPSTLDWDDITEPFHD
jgi:hypothetical protein